MSAYLPAVSKRLRCAFSCSRRLLCCQQAAHAVQRDADMHTDDSQGLEHSMKYFNFLACEALIAASDVPRLPVHACQPAAGAWCAGKQQCRGHRPCHASHCPACFPACCSGMALCQLHACAASLPVCLLPTRSRGVHPKKSCSCLGPRRTAGHDMHVAAHDHALDHRGASTPAVLSTAASDPPF